MQGTNYGTGAEWVERVVSEHGSGNVVEIVLRASKHRVEEFKRVPKSVRRPVARERVSEGDIEEWVLKWIRGWEGVFWATMAGVTAALPSRLFSELLRRGPDAVHVVTLEGFWSQAYDKKPPIRLTLRFFSSIRTWID